MNIQNILSGFVLRPARSASGNTETTGTATSGVVRHFENIEANFGQYILSERFGSQYRSAFIEGNGDTEEYLLWVGQNGNISETDAPLQTVESQLFPDENNIVNKIRIVDPNGRDILSTEAIRIVIAVGSGSVIELQKDIDFTWDAPYANITIAGQVLLQGGFQLDRGDVFALALYQLQPLGFYWVKNDTRTRFGWDAVKSTWASFKGTNIVNLGRLLADETYELKPKMPLEIGAFLKGDPSDPTVKATLRLGVLPTEAATTLKVKVVSDDGIEDYDFAGDLDEPDAVVGVVENTLVFDPTFVTNNIGKFIWLSYEDWQSESDGIMASMLDTLDSPVFLTPIPDYTDRPMIRMGSRRHLTPIACRTEAELNSVTLDENSFAWAESTGRCRFADALLRKSDPNDPLFDVLYYEDNVIYDGISHNTKPIPFPKARELTVNGDKYYLDDAETLPNGLFWSGFLKVPDGTGKIPSSLTVEPIPSGSGLVRKLKTVGDEVFFSSSYAIKNIEVVNAESELKWDWFIEKGTAMVCLENGEVRFNRKDNKNLKESGSGVFFRQGFVVPSRTISEASMPSRKEEPYVISEQGFFAFDINNQKFVCELNVQTTFTAEEAAQFLNSNSETVGGVSLDATTLGLFKAYNGRLYLETPDKTGSIRIAFGHDAFIAPTLDYTSRDLAGCSAFGFNCGWFIDTNEGHCYLNDSGMSFGLFRSPYNIDRESMTEELDFYSVQKTEGFIGDVREDFFHHIEQQPLKDMMGYKEGVFFNFRNGLSSKDLIHYTDIAYQFDNNRFMWITDQTYRQEVLTETQFLTLSPNMVLESSFISAFDKGIWVSDGSTFNYLTKDQDYLILDEGQTGNVALIEPVGEQITEGFNGASNGNELTIDTTHLALVQPKDRVKILGGSLEGSYKVQEVLNNKILVQPQFAENLTNLNYQIFSGANPKSIHADRVLYGTSHLPAETFVIRLVEKIGESELGGEFAIDVGDADTYGREVFFRVNDLSDDNNDYTPIKIGNQLLGNPRNGIYVIDSPLLEREFLKISFGGGEFIYSKNNGNCHFVNTFSSNTGDYIEIGAFGSPIEGQVRFSDEAIENRGGRAYVVPDISDPTLLSHDEFYYSSRSVYVPSSQIGNVYLVQKAILGLDVQTNPIGGALNFSKTLKKGTVVEARYFLADDDGEKLRDDDGVLLPQVFDQLPVFRRQVVATLVEHEPDVGFFKAEVDIGEDTLVEIGAISVWTGARLLTDGYTIEIDNVNKKIIVEGTSPSLLKDTPLYSEIVKVNYQVYEADGGEQSYTTSNNPIYRPPFRLLEEEDTFTLESDRTDDFVVDGVIWIDGFLLKILESNYDGTHTEVKISPAPQKEIGSLSPANDSDMLVSGKSIFEDTDFWVDILVEYLPADRGMTEVVFEGNLSELIETNSILQLGEDIFLVEDTELSDEGDFTLVKLQSPLANGYKFDTHVPSVSVRPVFAENDSEFEIGASVPDTYFELVLFEEGKVGRTLIENVDYEGDSDEGEIRFLAKFQRGLKKGDVLWVSRTHLSELSPFFQNGQVVVPNVVARYLHSYIRERAGFIEGNYFYSQPDAFFCRVAKNETYLAEVAKEFAQNMNPNRTGGSATGFSTQTKNFTVGTLGSRGKYKNTLNQDQASRMFIEIYNRIIVGFEQVRETVTGGFIGDRDGKFKFFVGRDNDLTPKGYENPFTGSLRPRNVWEEFFNDTLEDLGLNPIPLTTSDAIVQPDSSAYRDDYLLRGDDLNLNQIRGFLDEQKIYTRNDIDDLVLVGREGLRFDFTRGFWTQGVFKSMGDNHTVSRLFPERTNMFMRTYAGALIGVAGEHGVYTNGREYEEEWYSTKGTQIGAIGNPVLGTINNISDLNIQKRLARGRVYDYSPTGFPTLEDAFGVTIGEKPAVVISIVPLGQFPTDSTGIPDTSRFVSMSATGETFDASSGDYDLHTPPFRQGDKVYVGFPNGDISPTNFFIDEVIAGCVLTFQDEEGNAIATKDDFVTPNGDEIRLGYGDSLFIGTTDQFSEDLSDPTLDEESELRGKSDAYTTWWDFSLDRKSGKMIDNTLSSAADDRFDWQKHLKQKPLSPYECLEGATFFYNGESQPTKLPCLLGEEKNDSGDYTLPYLLEGETELQVLGRMAKAFDFIFKQDGTLTAPTNAEYPDEVTGRTGNLTAELVLTDSVNFTPISGAYVPRTGLANVRPYDLLLVEPIDSNYQSWQGILSVGSVTQDTVGVPRLISEINGVLDRYVAYNVMAHVATVTDPITSEGENGMVILEDAVNNYTTFDISSQTTFSWEGFVAWFKQTIDTAVPEGNRNAARIQLINHATGNVLSELDLHHTLNVGVNVDSKILQNGVITVIDLVDMNSIDPVTYPTPNVVLGLLGTGWFDFGLVGTPIGGDPTVFFDFTLSLNTFDDTWGGVGVPNTVSPYTGSLLSVVGEDRLKYDFGIAGLVSTVRETVHPNDNTLSLASTLEILQGEHEFGVDYGDGYLMGKIHNSNLINDLTPFTFLTDDFTIPSWEGSGNTPLAITDIRFSAMASSDKNGMGIICDGEGFITNGSLAITCDIGNQDTTLVNPYVPTTLTINNGLLEHIQKGDVLVVQPSGKTAVTSGSYIIRNVVPPSDPADPYSEARSDVGVPYGSARILDTRPAKLSSLDTVNNTVSLNRVRIRDYFDTGDGNRTSFPSAGSVYIINSQGDEFGFEYDHAIDPIVENEVTNGFGSITFTISAVTKNGAASSFNDVVLVLGLVAYGETRYDFIDLLRGYQEFDPTTMLGLEAMEFFDETGVPLGAFPLGGFNLNATAAGQIGVFEGTAYTDHGTFDPEAQIFTQGVATHIDIKEVLATLGVDYLKKDYTYDITMKDLAGIFIEPSTPIPVQDLGEAEPRVVSNSLPMDNGNVGVRGFASYLTDKTNYPYGLDTLDFYESVRFSVRRVRRWHEIQERLNEPLHLLPPIYFKRKGSVLSWVDDRALELSELDIFGGFSDGYVHRGDTLRILKDGILVEEHTITTTEQFPIIWTRQQIQTADIQANPTDYTYEVYLRQGMIPHEQSWDELVDIMTSEVVKRGEDGRCVVRNTLEGSDLASVQEGDLVIIDPHPDGFRPMGDRGVTGRVGFVAGLPSELDDNRGFYRVKTNNGTSLDLDGINEFAGIVGGEAVFGSVGQEYAVYPTINGTFPVTTPSPDGEDEAQNDLRPTAPIDPIDGYAGNYFSIEPFSYKVVRPTGLFSEEMIDLVLTQRERTLSWMEEILEPSRKNKAGDYYTFQLEDHILELDDPTDTSRGYGLVSNALMESLAGVRTIAPFLNTSDCLSVQDRRYWCGEYNLDYETPIDPADTTPFASFERDGTVLIRGSGRPHLIDRVDDILNSSDRLRNLRYTWISFRTNKARGTLPTAKRARGVLLQDLYDEQELINIKKSVENL